MEHVRRIGSTATVVALLGMVVLLDQVLKWWAWRHAPVVHINEGGNPFVGEVIGGWYADPATGALLDLCGAALLSTAIVMLVRRSQPAAIRVPAALMVAGWSSNLLDRLVLHHLTAPGSARGAVDFIHIGSCYYNVADFFIGFATPAFLLAGLLVNLRSLTAPQPLRRTT